jgi:hypothetical protein
VLKDARHSAKGSSARPMSREEVELKYRRLATKALPEGQVRRVQELVYRVDRIEDVGLLARELVRSSEDKT